MSNISMDKVMNLIVEKIVSFSEGGVRIVLIVIAGFILLRVVSFLLHRMEGILIKAREAEETVPGSTQKRVMTLSGILRTIARFVIWAIVIILCLDQVGVNVAPIIAGAGIAGLAFGFGAQNLVKDFISGFFMVLEDQVRVGDVAVVNGTGGVVEAISFRTIVLRDLSGVVHVFPNGTVSTLANMTKGWSAYLIDVGVAYKEDTDQVSAVMREVADGMQREAEFGEKMLGPIEIFGVDQYGSSEVVIKARLRTHPIQQWFIGREYRRRLKKAFDARGIEIPFPHLSLYTGEATKPFPLEVLSKQAAPA
jgi:small-conductance mechanosensitive channel